MKLFSGFKKDNSSNQAKKNQKFPWIDLTSLDQLSEIQEQSKLTSVVIFKHSTRCVIAAWYCENLRAVLQKMEKVLSYIF